MLLAQADVFDHRDEIVRFAIAVADQGHPQVGPQLAAIGTVVAFFHAVAADLTTEQLLHLL